MVAQLPESTEEHGATVKTLKKDGDRVVLQPENAAYEPIPADDAMIVGKVVGIMRQL